MKKIYTLITISLLYLCAFNATAQTGKLADPFKQDVMQGSVNRYTANGGIAKTNSIYVWYVQEWDATLGSSGDWKAAATGSYEFVKGYAPYEIDAATGAYKLDSSGDKILLKEDMNQKNLVVVYVLWTDKADITKKYRVRVDEKSSTSECYDPNLNANVVDVTVKENDFEISLTKWDKASGNTSSDGKPDVECAIMQDNSIGFLVSKNGGAVKYDDWKLSYKYRILDNDGTELVTWTPVNGLAASIADKNDIDDDIKNAKDTGNETTELLCLIVIDKTKYAGLDTKLIGDNGKITIEVEVVDATDHRGMQAKNFATGATKKQLASCKASVEVNKIPAAQVIELD